MISSLNNLMRPISERQVAATSKSDSPPAAGPDIEECRRMMSSGDLAGAERAARSVLAVSSDNGEAWYQLGMIAHRRGDSAGALKYLRTAAELSPLEAEIQNHYGNALRVTGLFSEALEMYRLAAGLKSGYAAPFYNIGLIQIALGHLGEAASAFGQCLTLDPSFSSARIRLGVLRIDEGDYHAAERLFRCELDTNPGSLEALNNLGIVLTRLKQNDEALEVCRRGLALAPGSAELHNTCGMALRESGRLAEAIASYRHAHDLDPVNPYILNNLGSSLREAAKMAEAISFLRESLTLKPDYATAWHNLGICLGEIAELQDAVEAFRRALDFWPGNAAVLNDLAGVLAAQGKVESAVETYRKAVESDPALLIACSNMLLTMQYSPHYSASEIYRESRRYEVLCGGSTGRRHSNTPDPERRLRVGYVSPDFRRHSVSYFLHSLIANHSPSEVFTACYSDVLVPDEHTEYYRSQADCWRNVCGLSDGQVADLVAGDKIDILVDLSGHTGQRLPLFATKPAPVQVTWLGYPDTTGLQAIDYRFSDTVTDPEGEVGHYCSEKIYRLPDGFLCYTAPSDAPDVCLPPTVSSGRITFGSFNNISKVTPQVVAVWCDLLKRVPGSRLIIKSHSLADKATHGYYQELICRSGISPDRVELRPRVKETGSHLAVYGEIDIALDTFPYNGTTTTCEALWMGVPVVSLAGGRHAGRVGASILARVGLADLVAESPDRYLDAAELLARDMDRLTRIRTTLRSTMASSPLCNGSRFAAAIENAYRRMWREWCDGQLNSN